VAELEVGVAVESAQTDSGTQLGAVEVKAEM